MHQHFFSHGLSSFFVGAANRFLGDALDDSHLDYPILEKLKRPASDSVRRSGTSEGDEFCFLFSIESPLSALLLLGPLDLFSKRLHRVICLGPAKTDVSSGNRGANDFLSDGGIRFSLSGEEQNLRSVPLQATVAVVACDAGELLLLGLG